MKSKNRILFIVPLPPPVHGSAVMCKYVTDSKLLNENFECDSVNLSTSRRTDETGKFKIIKLWRFLGAYISVFFKLLAHRYDLCYVAIAFHKGLLKDAPFVLMCKLFGRKVVLHLHGKGASEDAKKPFYRWLLRKTFKDTKVIMLSWLLYPDVEQFVKREDVFICPNGIPVVDFKRRETENPIPHLLYLSNLKEDKGVIVLLDALKILMEKGYSFRCDFVGGESKDLDAERFSQEVAKRGLNSIAFYLGKKYGDDKEKALEQADVFVFPTFYYNECFPLVLLEAQQHSLPIVTTNEGAIADIVKNEENGFVCKRNDVETLVDSLEKLINDKNIQRNIGENNFKKYQENFTIECFENNVYGILSKIVDRKNN